MLKESPEIPSYGERRQMEAVSILGSVRIALGLSMEDESFSEEIKMHLNAALSILNQNGIGKPLTITGLDAKWGDFKDDSQVEGNEYFNMIPMFVQTSIKILFDPPPPSNVQYYNNYIQELLWRLRIAYEQK